MDRRGENIELIESGNDDEKRDVIRYYRGGNLKSRIDDKEISDDRKLKIGIIRLIDDLSYVAGVKLHEVEWKFEKELQERIRSVGLREKFGKQLSSLINKFRERKDILFVDEKRDNLEKIESEISRELELDSFQNDLIGEKKEGDDRNNKLEEKRKELVLDMNVVRLIADRKRQLGPSVWDELHKLGFYMKPDKRQDNQVWGAVDIMIGSDDSKKKEAENFLIEYFRVEDGGNLQEYEKTKIKEKDQLSGLSKKQLYKMIPENLNPDLSKRLFRAANAISGDLSYLDFASVDFAKDFFEEYTKPKKLDINKSKEGGESKSDEKWMVAMEWLGQIEGADVVKRKEIFEKLEAGGVRIGGAIGDLTRAGASEEQMKQIYHHMANMVKLRDMRVEMVRREYPVMVEKYADLAKLMRLEWYN